MLPARRAHIMKEEKRKEKYKPSPGFGGNREGSGRKHTRHQFTTQIDLDLWEEIKDMEKKNDFINMCIREYFEKGKEAAN